MERERERERGGGQKIKKTKGKVSALVIPSSDFEDFDTQCVFCGELYSNTREEDWIQCTACSKWVHDDCAGVDPDDDHFACDLCADMEGETCVQMWKVRLVCRCGRLDLCADVEG